MLEKDLETLKNVPLDRRSLEGLETAIWTKVAANAQLAHGRSLILGWQASVVALVVVGSFVVTGVTTTNEHPIFDQLDAFSADGLPAPSTLLLGKHT
ncbi:MAG: hypothetical protein K2P94_08375 [Rhodospirillaceae bacterium]|nr:hypothetical protein [Rhodospirillaceae bacterium]